MAYLRHLWQNLARRRRVEQDLDQEVTAYLACWRRRHRRVKQGSKQAALSN